MLVTPWSRPHQPEAPRPSFDTAPPESRASCAAGAGSRWNNCWRHTRQARRVWRGGAARCVALPSGAPPSCMPGESQHGSSAAVSRGRILVGGLQAVPRGPRARAARATTRIGQFRKLAEDGVPFGRLSTSVAAIFAPEFCSPNTERLLETNSVNSGTVVGGHLPGDRDSAASTDCDARAPIRSPVFRPLRRAGWRAGWKGLEGGARSACCRAASTAERQLVRRPGAMLVADATPMLNRCGTPAPEAVVDLIVLAPLHGCGAAKAACPRPRPYALDPLDDADHMRIGLKRLFPDLHRRRRFADGVVDQPRSGDVRPRQVTADLGQGFRMSATTTCRVPHQVMDRRPLVPAFGETRITAHDPVEIGKRPLRPLSPWRRRSASMRRSISATPRWTSAFRSGSLWPRLRKGWS